MATDIPVKIVFEADAGNVKRATEELRRDLAGLLGTQGRALPKLNLEASVSLDQARADLLALTRSDLKLPPLVVPFQAPKGLGTTAADVQNLKAASQALAGVQLGQIRQDLNAVLNISGLAGQAQGYAAIVARLGEWKQANGEVLASSQALQAQYATLTQSASQGLQEVADRSRSLAGIAGSIAGAFAGVGTFLAGIAVGSLAIAGNFEQLQARLVSVTGSTAAAAEKFKFVQDLAAKTPFDVRGLVAASSTLESLGQNTEEFLPVAANLAAAMGKSLPEAVLTFAKAASGSSEGFESLRNEYGITTGALLKFGAVQGEVAGQLSHAESAIEQNRTALVKLISTKFGDAIDRQSKTLTGAMTNVGDAAETAAAGFGQGLIPAATLSAKALAYMLGIVSNIPGPLKVLGAASAVALAGVAGIGATAFGSVAAFLLLQASLASTVLQLQQLKIEAPQAGAALQFLSTGANRVSGAMTASRLAMVAFGTGILAVAAIAATSGLALADSWEKASVQLGDAITDSSRQAASANAFFRQGIAGLNEAGKEAGVAVSIVGDARVQMEQINKAFATLPKEAVVKVFTDMGIGAETLREQLKGTERGVTSMKERLEALTKARAQFETVNGNLIQPLSLSGSQQEAVDGLRAMGIELGSLDEAIQQTQFHLERLGAVGVLASKGLAAINEVEPPLKRATAASEQLAKFIDLTKQLGTTKSLTAALGGLNSQIQANAALIKDGGTNLDALLAKEQKASGAEKALLLAQIGLIQQRDSITKDLSDREAAAAKAVTDAQELAFRRKKALGEANVHDELNFVNERIKNAKVGSEEEVALQERKAGLTEKVQQDQLKRLQASLQKQLDEGKRAVEDAQAGIGGKTVQQALEESKAGVDRWAAANKPLAQSLGVIRTKLDEFAASNAIDVQKAKAADLKTGLQTMVQGFQTSIAEAAGAENKLAVVSGAITSLQRARAAGLVDIKGATAEITRLTVQQLGLEKEVTREKQQQAISQAGAGITNLEGELSILQARKSGGEQVEAEITANREEQFQKRLALIELEKQAAINSGHSRAAAEQDAQNKITQATGQNKLQQLQDYNEKKQKAAQQAQQLEAIDLQTLESEAQVLEARKANGEEVELQITANHRAQVQERVNLIALELAAALASGQDRVTAEATAQGKLTQLQNQEKARLLQHQQDLQKIRSQVGGPNSPLFSDASEGLGIRFGPSTFGDLTPRFNAGLPSPVLPAQRQDILKKSKEQQQTPNTGPGGGGQGGGNAADAGKGGGSVNNYNNNFNGVPFSSPEFSRAVQAEMIKLQADTRLRRK